MSKISNVNITFEGSRYERLLEKQRPKKIKQREAVYDLTHHQNL
jgi:hypothetical protein